MQSELELLVRRLQTPVVASQHCAAINLPVAPPALVAVSSRTHILADVSPSRTTTPCHGKGTGGDGAGVEGGVDGGEGGRAGRGIDGGVVGGVGGHAGGGFAGTGCWDIGPLACASEDLRSTLGRMHSCNYNYLLVLVI